MPRLAANPAWRDVVTIHRLEFPFPVNYLCYASWGACFAAGDGGRLPALPVFAAILANLLLITAAMALNTAADVRTDERHPEKSHRGSAARRCGRGRIIRWVATETAIGLMLAGLVSQWSDRPAIAVAAAVGVALQVLYNTEPIRLKGRGFTGVAVFCAAMLGPPFLLSYLAVRPDVGAPAWMVLAGLWLMAIGRMTVWSVPDRTADAVTGVRTPSVRYGAAGALGRSAVAVAAGLILAGWGLWWQFGPALALPLTALQATFLYSVVILLRHPGAPASSVRIRLRAMPPATIGMVALTVVPLLAG